MTTDLADLDLIMGAGEARLLGAIGHVVLSVARGMRERWGMPFFEGSFYGIANTSQALRDFARLLDDADLAARTEVLIAREEAAAASALADYRRRLSGKRVLIFSGGFKSWSVIAAMQELGLTVVATGTEKSTEEDKARICALMGPKALMIEDNDQTGLLPTRRISSPPGTATFTRRSRRGCRFSTSIMSARSAMPVMAASSSLPGR
ncbi:MAG: nitrogenase component 1 [Rhodospirillales bacterium]